MKAYLTFSYNPDNPDDRQSIERIQNATDWYLVVWELDQFFRRKVKYEDSQMHEEVRGELHDILAASGLTLD